MGRPPAVDAAAIVRAAVEVGFERLTVSAVASRLGVSHSTLYRYFGSRDALVSAAIDQAVAAVAWPQPGPGYAWREFLVATARAYWSLYEPHPGLAVEVSALRSTSRGLVEVANRSMLALVDYGFDPEQAVLVVDIVGELATQAFLGASNPPTSGRSRGGPHAFSVIEGVRRRRVELAGAWLAHYDPRLREAFTAVITRPPVEQFNRKLSIVLDGVARLLAPDAP